MSSGHRAKLVEQAGQVGLDGWWLGRPCTRVSAFAPIPGATVWSAVIRYVQKVAVSLSPGSSDNHAGASVSSGPGQPLGQQCRLAEASRRETSVSFDSDSAASRALSRGRGTRPVGAWGRRTWSRAAGQA